MPRFQSLLGAMIWNRFRNNIDFCKKSQILGVHCPMAKGLKQHQERQEKLSLFGKDLARRCKSKCEICESGGIKLLPFEVEPKPAEPDFDCCIMVCESCAEQISNPKKLQVGEHWRCLAQVVWSEIPAVQVVAVRLLKRLAETQDWARETLDQVFLDEPIEEWVVKVD